MKLDNILHDFCELKCNRFESGMSWMTRVKCIQSEILFLDICVGWLSMSILVIIFDVGFMVTFYFIYILMNIIKVAYSTNAAN